MAADKGRWRSMSRKRVKPYEKSRDMFHATYATSTKLSWARSDVESSPVDCISETDAVAHYCCNCKLHVGTDKKSLRMTNKMYWFTLPKHCERCNTTAYYVPCVELLKIMKKMCENGGEVTLCPNFNKNDNPSRAGIVLSGEFDVLKLLLSKCTEVDTVDWAKEYCEPLIIKSPQVGRKMDKSHYDELTNLLVDNISKAMGIIIKREHIFGFLRHFRDIQNPIVAIIEYVTDRSRRYGYRHNNLTIPVGKCRMKYDPDTESVIMEEPFFTAKREFEEETGIKLPDKAEYLSKFRSGNLILYHMKIDDIPDIIDEEMICAT
jgi:hypothetical protein